MPFMQIGDKMRIGYDPATGERGTQMRLLNKTGAASVKGSLVEADDTVDQAFQLIPADDPDPIGIVYEAGVADGEECWVWVPQSLCQVLLEDGTVMYWDYHVDAYTNLMLFVLGPICGEALAVIVVVVMWLFIGIRAIIARQRD